MDEQTIRDNVFAALRTVAPEVTPDNRGRQAAA